MRTDWIEVELKKAGDIVTGGTPSKNENDFYNKNEFPFFKPTDLNQGINTDSSTDFLSAAGYMNSRKAPKGSVLVTCIGATIGKTGLIRREGAFNQQINAILPFSHIDSKFLFFQIVSGSFQKQIRESASSTTLPILNKSKFSELVVHLAPLPEQRAIVARIEELFSELDHAVSSLQSAQAKLDIYRQAVLKKAFEGGFTEEWRFQNPGVSSFDFLSNISESRKKNPFPKNSIYHKKIGHDFQFSKFSNIPSWSKASLDKLIFIAARIGWRGLKKDEYTDDGPYFLSVHALNYGKYVDFSQAFHISKERYLESPEITLQEGDVLLCKDGAGIGKLAIVKGLESEATVNSSLLVIRGLEVLTQDFIYYLFCGPGLQKLVFERITGSATPHLFQNDIRKFELLIPPIQEQEQIVQEIESRLSVADKLAETIQTNLQKSEALRQSILKKAFEGRLLSEAEVEACRKEVDWEPAEGLLARIERSRNERIKQEKSKSKKS